MKTFYRLSLESQISCRKVIEAQKLLNEASHTLDIDYNLIETFIDVDPIMYLYKEFDNQEFCDRDSIFINSKIDFFDLERQGLIVETFQTDATLI